MGLYRYRSSNYTIAEKILLIEVIKEYADMIDCRRAEVATANGKTGVWDLIAETFNLRKGPLGPRPAMSLRKCYSNMKTIVKNVIRSHNLQSVTGSIQEDWEMNINAVASRLGLSYEVTYDFMYNVLKYRIQGDTLSLERVRKGAAQETSQQFVLPVREQSRSVDKESPSKDETTTVMPIIESVRTETETDETKEQVDVPEVEEKAADDVIPEPAVVWVTSEPSDYEFLPEDALYTESESQSEDVSQSNSKNSTQTEDQSGNSSSGTDVDEDTEDSNSSHVRKKLKV